MKLEYLEEFLTLAETSNYNIAAENLFVSASTLSRHIMLLEEELGTKLFNRGPRNVSLSKAGTLLVPFAKTIIEAKKKYIDVLETECSGHDQHLSIGFSRPVIQYGLLEDIFFFRDDNPDINASITESSPISLYQMLKNDEFDFILSYEYEEYGSNIETLPLVKDNLSVILPADHPLSTKESLSLQDLKDEHFILHLKNGPSHEQCVKLFQAAGINPDIRTRVQSGRFIVELVSSGIGISLIEDKRFRNELPCNVKMVPLEPRVDKTLSLIYKKHPFNEAESRFFEYIKDAFNCE